MRLVGVVDTDTQSKVAIIEQTEKGVQEIYKEKDIVFNDLVLDAIGRNYVILESKEGKKIKLTHLCQKVNSFKQELEEKTKSTVEERLKQVKEELSNKLALITFEKCEIPLDNLNSNSDQSAAGINSICYPKNSFENGFTLKYDSKKDRIVVSNVDRGYSGQGLLPDVIIENHFDEQMLKEPDFLGIDFKAKKVFNSENILRGIQVENGDGVLQQFGVPNGAILNKINSELITDVQDIGSIITQAIRRERPAEIKITFFTNGFEVNQTVLIR